MKRFMLAIVISAVCGLCGCQSLAPQAGGGGPKSPGTMTTGNWEFTLQYDSTHNGYVESNISSTSNAGVYKDSGGNTKFFILNSAAYFNNPGAMGGYAYQAGSYSFTLNVTSQLQVTGTLARNEGASINFTGTEASGGTTMTGTFVDGNGGSGTFTAAAAQLLDGNYATSPYTIGESISGNVITEASSNSSGDYNLSPIVGNMALLSTGIPVGGDGSITFWNNSGSCNTNQCSVFHDLSTGNLWVFMNSKNNPATTNQVLGVLYPGK